MTATTIRDTSDTGNTTSQRRTFSNIASETADVVSGAKDDLKEVARNAGMNVRNFVHARRHDIAEVTESATDTIRAKPLQSSLLALGAGFLLASLLRR